MNKYIKKNLIKIFSVALIVSLAVTALATANKGAFAAPATYKAYLNPGHGITMNGGKSGVDIPEMFLENCFEISGRAGIELTKPDLRDGYEFLGWSYAGGGTRVTITVMPEVDNLILYANWKSTAEIMADDYIEKEPVIFEGLYLSFTDSAKEFNPKYHFTKTYSSSYNDDEYSLKSVTLTAGQEFVLKSNGKLFSSVDDNVYPTLKSGKTTGIGYQFSADTAKGNYTKDYIYAASVANATVAANSGNTDVRYASGKEAAPLTVVKSGTYNIYIIIFASDNGGWVKLYVEPAV